MNFKQFLADILFPLSCAGCKSSLKKGVVCEPCFATIPLHQTLYCAVCDARLPLGKKTCHPTAFYMIGGAGAYHDPTLKELIGQLKFRGIRDAAQPLALLISCYLEQCLDPKFQKTCVIMPIPLSRRRQNERGFNQTEEIARHLARITMIPLTTNDLARTRHTKAQTQTDGIEERMQNLHDCFRASPAVAGKNILLIDDVTTSGTTFREAANVLKIAGAKKIIAVAAAKA